jgi:hypothetical protein
METKGNWTDLIAGVGLEMAEVFDQGQEEYTPGLTSVVRSNTGKGGQRNFSGKTGVGELQSFADGDDIPGGRRYKTYTTKIAYTNYGKFIDVTKNTIEDRDEAFEADLNEMKDLSVGAQYSQDRSAMQLFNGGFATTTTVNGYDMTWYGDGKPQFSTIHPTVVPGASTQSNASATSIAFGHDSLETGSLALELQKTDDGIPMVMAGKVTIVAPLALKREVQEETMSQLTPESAENAINVYANGTFDAVISKFLSATNGGSDSAWFLTIPSRAFLYHEVRQAPAMDKDVNIKNKVVTFTIDARWADYSKEYKRTWGSKGDNSAYSS